MGFESPNSSGSSLRTVRVTLALAADGDATSNTSTTFVNILQRFPVLLPATTTRWRMRISNKNIPNPTGIAGTITLTDIYLGTPALAAGVASGAFTAPPVKAIASSGQTFGGSTEYVSPWVTDTTQQFTRDVLSMLSIGSTSGNNQDVTQSSFGSYFWRGAGASESVGNATATGTAAVSGYFFDVRVEYEAAIPTTTPVVFCIGNSITAGFIDDSTQRGSVRSPAVTSYPAMAGMRGRFPWINAGVNAALATDFTDTSTIRYTRFDLTTTVPDVAVIGFGVVDANNSVAVATLMGTYQTLVTNLRALGIKKIVVVTPTLVSLSANYTAGNVMASVASGVSSVTTNVAFANNDSITIDRGKATEETLTVSGASTGSAAPFTTSFTGTTTQAHAIGATIGKPANNNLIDYAATMLLGIPGVSAVADVFSPFGDPRFPNTNDARWMGTGTVHPAAQGYERMAAVATGAIL